MSPGLDDLGLTAEVVLEMARGGILVLDREGRCQYASTHAGSLADRPVDELKGLSYLELFVPDDRELVRALFVDAPARQRASVRLLRPDHRPIHVMVDAFALSHEQVALVLLDFAEEARARRNALAQSQVAARITYGDSLPETMDALARSVCDATGCCACAVTLVEGEPARVQVIGAWTAMPEYADLVREAARRNWANILNVCRTGCVLVQTRQTHPISDMDEQLDASPFRCAVFLPLRYHGATLGALGCVYETAGAPDETEMQFLQTIADQAAVAVENARLFETAQDKAVLEERQRLARELHDSVSQALYGIGLGTRTALKRLEHDPQSAREPLEYVLSLAHAGLAEMRALIFELRPEALASEGLVVTLQHQLAAASARHGLGVTSRLCAEPRLDPAAREALYRVAREALTNIVKHAEAAHVEVTLETRGCLAVLAIADDGAGFDTLSSPPGHLGLTSMRERVEKVGGHFEVVSGAGRGTTVQASVPLTSD